MKKFALVSDMFDSHWSGVDKNKKIQRKNLSETTMRIFQRILRIDACNRRFFVAKWVLNSGQS